MYGIFYIDILYIILYNVFILKKKGDFEHWIDTE